MGSAAALLALLPHLPGLANGFVYDDFRFIAENPGVATLADPAGLLFDPARASTPVDHDIWRPLRTLGFALQHAAGGGSAWIFHATSLALFALLVRLLAALWRRVAGFPAAVAAAAALLFAVHPVTVESVAWASSQGDLLAAIGVVAALLLARRRPWVCTAVVLMALLGKESASPLAGGLALLWWHDRNDAAATGSPELERGSQAGSGRVRGATVVAAGLLTVGWLVARQQLLEREIDLSGSGLAQRSAPFVERLAESLRTFLFALRLIAWPWPLSIDHDAATFSPAALFGSAGLVLAALALIGAVLVTLLARRGEMRSRLLLPLGFALLFHLPTSGLLVALKSPTAERFLLLPLAGIVAAVTLLAARVAGTRAEDGRPRARRLRVLLCSVALPLALVTARRTADFRDDATLWHAELAHHPTSRQALLGALHDASVRGDDDEAAAFARRLISATAADDPRGWIARLRLGQLLVVDGQPAAMAALFSEVRLAIAARGHARGVAPELHLIHVGLANHARQHGDAAQAEALAREGIGWFGREPRLLEALGVARDLQGDADGAAALHREALALGPESASLHHHLALAERHRGNDAEARAAALRALELDPAHGAARRLLAELDR
jgi:tetratricopeptide (TPR) repeat protein